MVHFGIPCIFTFNFENLLNKSSGISKAAVWARQITSLPLSSSRVYSIFIVPKNIICLFSLLFLHIVKFDTWSTHEMLTPFNDKNRWSIGLLQCPKQENIVGSLRIIRLDFKTKLDQTGLLITIKMLIKFTGIKKVWGRAKPSTPCPIPNSLTCARSPSYLNSQVNLAPSKRVKTSLTPFVGCANMGFRGIPGVRRQWRGRPSIPSFRRQGMMRS